MVLLKKPCTSSNNLSKNVHLKVFWTLFKNVHCQGPCSLRPCILRPYCIARINYATPAFLFELRQTTFRPLQQLNKKMILINCKNLITITITLIFENSIVIQSKSNFQNKHLLCTQIIGHLALDRQYVYRSGDQD